jgi:hypothetical protein
MNTKSVVHLLTIAALCMPLLAGAAGLNIKGTYVLVSRDTADGKTLTPPAVVGMLTYTSEYRSFNANWTTPDGKHVSVAYIAKYHLSPNQYRETPIYWMSNNLGAPGLSYDIPKNKGDATPVTKKADGTVEFSIAGEPPVVAFKGDTLTATAKSPDGKLLFVDHWKKVK